MTVELGPSSRVVLRPLQMRPDADQWCVGRVDTGQFAVIDQTAADALRLLGDGLTVAAVADRLRADHRRNVDVLAFVDQLIDLGFVAAVAVIGRAVVGPQSAAGAVLGAIALLTLMPLGWQCLVFMRTDLYFVLADPWRVGPGAPARPPAHCLVTLVDPAAAARKGVIAWRSSRSASSRRSRPRTR